MTAEIQCIKRDTFEIFTPNNKNHCETPLREGEVAEMATGGKEEREEGQNTQPETKEEVPILANTHFKASSPSACSAVHLFSRAVNKKQGAKDYYFCQKGKKINIQQV